MGLSEACFQFSQTHPRLPPLSYDHLLSLLARCPKCHPPAPPQEYALATPSSLTSSLTWHGVASSSASAHPVLRPSSRCKDCDPAFFPLITNELEADMNVFNSRVRLLLHTHLAWGLKKAVLQLTHKQTRNPVAMVHEGQVLVGYASLMTRAVRSILHEYDTVHGSCEGSDFRSWLVSKHMEVMQSPMLMELLALYLNLTSRYGGQGALPEICDGIICDLESAKPILSCSPHGSLKWDVDMSCSICLEIFFEPVALKCSHIFCFSCACAAASVHTFEGLRKAKSTAKCPLCREVGVFPGAVRLTEFHLMVKIRCEDYWKSRLHRERKERMHEIKEHWRYKPEDVRPSPFQYG